MWLNYQTECLWRWWVMMQTQNGNGKMSDPSFKLNFADNQYVDEYGSLFAT